MLVTIRHQVFDQRWRCAVSQHQGNSGPPWTGILPNLPDFAAIYTKGAENLSAMQREWLEMLEHTKSGWAARLEAEAKLGSDFAAKVAAARAVPDAAAAYQEWTTQRMDLLSKEWRKAMEDGQKFMNAFVRITGNGRGLGGS
jgi:hypothetical protein